MSVVQFIGAGALLTIVTIVAYFAGVAMGIRLARIDQQIEVIEKWIKEPRN